MDFWNKILSSDIKPINGRPSWQLNHERKYPLLIDQGPLAGGYISYNNDFQAVEDSQPQTISVIDRRRVTALNSSLFQSMLGKLAIANIVRVANLAISHSLSS